MISFNNLGNMGRLGNQMFQYAALRGIAKNRNFDFCIPPKNFAGNCDNNVKNSDGNIYNIFRLNVVNYNHTNNLSIAEKTFNFDEDLFNNCPDNVDIVGYFQNEKYFLDIEEEIKREFTFSENTLNKCKDFLGENEYISLHIRRGDYVKNPNHPLQPIEYFTKALSYFDTSIPVLVFSDDFEWCRNQELFDSDRFLISENNCTEVDLCLQSLCSYHIISNSSFSWWGSYLADSKLTIAPKLWFSGSLKEKDSSGIYRKNWIVI